MSVARSRAPIADERAGSCAPSPDTGAHAAVAERPVSISVIIPSYNARDVILDCLDALSSQEGDVESEIIVVDSSGDGTADLVEQHFPDVTVIRLARRTHPGSARNFGARQATGRILAFTDADCLPDPGWLRTLERLHHAAPAGETGRVAIAGGIDNGVPESAIGTADWLIEFACAGTGLPAGPRLFAPTANFSLPRDLFLALGGFDDNRTAEDIAFGRALHAAGHRIEFHGHAVIRHRGRTRLGPFLRKQFELALGSALVRRRIALPGSWIVRVPPLIPLLPIYRLVRILRAARGCRVLTLVRAAPWVAAGLAAWTGGFLAGALRRRPSPHWNFQTRGLACQPAEGSDISVRKPSCSRCHGGADHRCDPS